MLRGCVFLFSCICPSRLIIPFDNGAGGARRFLHRAKLRENKTRRDVVTTGQYKFLHGLLQRGAELLILPKLATGKLTQRVSDEGQPRHVNKMTTRAMLAWRHAEFRTLMANTLRFFPDVRVLHSTEDYTSKGTAPLLVLAGRACWLAWR